MDNKNKEFKKYVDTYAKVHNIKPEAAFTHAIIYITGEAYYDKRKEGEE